MFDASPTYKVKKIGGPKHMHNVLILLLLLPEGVGDDGEPGGNVLGAVHGRGCSVDACI